MNAFREITIYLRFILEIHFGTPLTTQPVNRAIKSNLCLHLGLCAQSSENCLKRPTAGVDTLFWDTSTRTEIGRKATRPSVNGGNNLVSHVEEVWPNNLSYGAVVHCLSRIGQRDAHFKSSDLHTCLFQRRDSYRYSL